MSLRSLEMWLFVAAVLTTVLWMHRQVVDPSAHHLLASLLAADLVASVSDGGR